VDVMVPGMETIRLSTRYFLGFFPETMT
jgi:hypothetical protein